MSQIKSRLDHPDFKQFISDWLRVKSDSTGKPGFVISVHHQGQPVLVDQFCIPGKTAPENRLFNIGSIAKTMTALLALTLVEQNRIQLEDSIADYLPWLKTHKDTRYQRISIDNLLSHTAGLSRDGVESDRYLLDRPYPNRQQMIDEILETDLVLDPGHKFKYSNYGYVLLGMLIEEVSGLSYAEYANKIIIAPLGLKNTFIECSKELVPRIEQGYSSLIAGTHHPVPKYIPVNSYQPTVGWFSTAEDLNTLIAAICGSSDPLLGVDMQRLMLRGNTGHWQPSKFQGTRYGMGIIQEQHQGNSIYGHSGTFIGHRSGAYYNSDNDVSIVALGTCRDTPITQIIVGALRAADFFLSKPAPQPWNTPKINGSYMNSGMSRSIIVGGNDGLSLPLDSWDPFRYAEKLSKDSADKYTITKALDLLAEGEQITHHTNSDGRSHIKYAGGSVWPIDDFFAHVRQNKGLYQQWNSIV